MKNERKILIVEDKPYNIFIMQILIKLSGYPYLMNIVDKCNNGQEALDKFR